ncbi:RIB5 [Symbiodinium sp. KB8]|nr:RIB5 [Symbiodinium sp. KB8]
MFTGIVEEMGEVLLVQQSSMVPLWDGTKGKGVLLTISAKATLGGAYIGASIAVNGVCLTIVSFTQDSFTFGIAPETLRRTNLSSVQEGDKVNLERSQASDGRNSGHYVQGHVDGTARLVDTRKDGDSLWVRLAASEELLKYIVPKGYVAVDGTSLTVVDVRRGGHAHGAAANCAAVQLLEGEAGWFSFMLVSHTQQCIVMPHKAPGAPINIEVDVMAKYVERSLAQHGQAIAPSGWHQSAGSWAVGLAAAALAVATAALVVAMRKGGQPKRESAP